MVETWLPLVACVGLARFDCCCCLLDCFISLRGLPVLSTLRVGVIGPHGIFSMGFRSEGIADKVEDGEYHKADCIDQKIWRLWSGNATSADIVHISECGITIDMKT